MRAYCGVTGKNDLSGFWKISPAELFAWCDAMTEADAGEEWENMEIGEEVED